jgi:polyphosphate kinase 2
MGKKHRDDPLTDEPADADGDGRLSRDEYEDELTRLQIELIKLQQWVVKKGERIVILFEGRDAAGKGGTILRLMQHLNPRGARKVALAKPSDTERGQWYFQRYVAHLPTAGEIVVFDRSWYNRAGVERVMGFCNDDEYERFMKSVPQFEQMLVRDGITIIKLWLDVTKKEQKERFAARAKSPLKQWKLSPMDAEAQKRWDAYGEAKRAMFKRTATPDAPWTVVKSVDKKRARLNALRFILSQFDYKGRDKKVACAPDPAIVGSALDPKFGQGD